MNGIYVMMDLDNVYCVQVYLYIFVVFWKMPLDMLEILFTCKLDIF